MPASTQVDVCVLCVVCVAVSHRWLMRSGCWLSAAFLARSRVASDALTAIRWSSVNTRQPALINTCGGGGVTGREGEVDKGTAGRARVEYACHCAMPGVTQRVE